MKQRPSNPSEGRRRAQAADDAEIIKSRKENPWEHDLDLVNVIEGKGRDVARNLDPKKLLDALEGNIAEEKITLKLPGIVKDPLAEALKNHPLQMDQHKYLKTNLKRFNKKEKEEKKAKKAASIAAAANATTSNGSKRQVPKEDESMSFEIDTSNPVFARAVSDLPESKQKSLLETLSKISKSLEFGGLSTEVDTNSSVASNVWSTQAMEKMQSKIHHITAHNNDDISVRSQMSMKSIGGRSALSNATGRSGQDSTSLTSSYATATQYGKYDTDASEQSSIAVLNRIGEGMHLNPDNVHKHSIVLGRGPSKTIAADMVAPTEIMAVMSTDFNVKLTNYELEAIMNKFDVDKLGIASMGAILGSSQLAYSKTVYQKQVDKNAKNQNIAKKELLEKRAEYKSKLGTKELDGTIVEGTMKRDAMKGIIEKLAQAAYLAIRGKNLKCINDARALVTQKEFRSILNELNCGLLPREISMLERRYYIASSGSVDTRAFQVEFIALGKDVIKERMRAEALQSFLKTLAKTNPDKQPRYAVDNDGQEDAAENTTVTDTNSVEVAPETKLTSDEALNKAIAENDIKPIDKSKFSIEMADEWIANPLAMKSPVKRVFNVSSKVGSGINNSSFNSAANNDIFAPKIKNTMINSMLAAEDAAKNNSRALDGESEKSSAQQSSIGDNASSAILSHGEILKTSNKPNITSNYDNDDASSIGMSSLTSAADISAHHDALGGNMSVCDTVMTPSAATLLRQKKREEFYMKDNARRGGPPVPTGFESSSNKGSSINGTINGNNSITSGDGKSSIESSLVGMSVTSNRSYRPQADIDLGRDNPSSSAFEENIGSLELPYELPLFNESSTHQSNLSKTKLTQKVIEEHDRIGEDETNQNNEIQSISTALVGDLTGKREIAILKTLHGSRPTTREIKAAVEQQRCEEEHARRMNERLVEEKRIYDEKIANEKHEAKLLAEAQARLLKAEKLITEEKEVARVAEAKRVAVEAEAKLQEEKAAAVLRNAANTAAIEKSEMSRKLALQAAQLQKEAQEHSKAVILQVTADREMASRPKTQEKKPPLSPPPRSRQESRPGTRGPLGGSRASSSHNRSQSDIKMEKQPIQSGIPLPVRLVGTPQLVPSPITIDESNGTTEATSSRSNGFSMIPVSAKHAQQLSETSTTVHTVAPIAVKPTAAIASSAPQPSPAFEYDHQADYEYPERFGANIKYKCDTLDKQLVSIDTLEESEDLDMKALSDAYYFMGMYRNDEGKHLDALAGLERSYRLYEWKEPDVIIRRLKQLALLAAAVDGMYEKCQRLCLELQDEADTHYGIEDNEYARVCYFIAEIKAGFELNTDAVDLLHKAITIFDDNLGENNAETLHSKHALAHLMSGSNRDNEDEEVVPYDENDDDIEGNEGGTAAGVLEEFDLYGEHWEVYETTTDIGETHIYYLAQLAGTQHSQWEDPRTHGIIDFIEDGKTEDEDDDNDGYDLGIHTIVGLPIGASGNKTPKKNNISNNLLELDDPLRMSLDNDDDAADVGAYDAHTWQTKRLNEEISMALGDTEVAVNHEDDDDVLNASSSSVVKGALNNEKSEVDPQLAMGSRKRNETEQMQTFSMKGSIKI